MRDEQFLPIYQLADGKTNKDNLTSNLSEKSYPNVP